MYRISSNPSEIDESSMIFGGRRLLFPRGLAVVTGSAEIHTKLMK